MLLLPSHPRGTTREELTRWLMDRCRDGFFLLLDDYDFRSPRGESLKQFAEDWQTYWSSRWRKKLVPLDYRLTRYRLVRLDKLYATQSTLKIESLLFVLSGRAALRYFGPQADISLPWAVKVGRRYYVMDGHHRLWLSAALGQRAVWIRVLNGNYYFKRYPVPPN
ncbi:hypothetical protein Rctr85_042 [Virus Rctr85]|nr:hypothetical protein Rctr85_042 [Virus Rctr85]